MKSRSVWVLLILLFAILFFIYKFWSQPAKAEFAFYPMGGVPCRIVIYTDDSASAAKQAKEVQDEVERLEDIFNNYRPSSEVSRLNGSPANQWLSVSSEMYTMLERSIAWYGKTTGAFDITVAPVIDVWKEAAKENKLQADSAIKDALKRVGSSKITISPEKGVEFAVNDMELDFGGIAKGYILDKMGEKLEKNGTDKYVVSCGGDVRMRGKDEFRVGIQEPGKKEGELMMVLKIPSGAVVTSGHYERYFTVDGKNYSHIIDPKTGQPVPTDLASITIVAKDTTDADALATAVAVLGFDKAVEFLNSGDTYKAVLLKKAGNGFEIYYSKALSGSLEYKGRWANILHKEF